MDFRIVTRMELAQVEVCD